MDLMDTAKRLGQWTASTGFVISYRCKFQAHVFIVGAMMPVPTVLPGPAVNIFTVTQQPWSPIYVWNEK